MHPPRDIHNLCGGTERGGSLGAVRLIGVIWWLHGGWDAANIFERPHVFFREVVQRGLLSVQTYPL